VGSLLRFSSVWHSLAKQEQDAGRTPHWRTWAILPIWVVAMNSTEPMRRWPSISQWKDSLAWPPATTTRHSPGISSGAILGPGLSLAKCGKATAARTCSGRLEKAPSDRGLMNYWRGAVEANGGSMQPSWGRLYSWLTDRGSALATVSPLGIVHHNGQPHGLLAISSTRLTNANGTTALQAILAPCPRPGRQAARSQQDGRAAQGRLVCRKAPLLDFGHSPIRTLTRKAKQQLGRLVGRLDDGKAQGGGLSGRAHAQEVAAAECLAGRRLPEVIIDRPWIPRKKRRLCAWPDASGALTVRVRALGLVDVQSRSCGREPTIAASECTTLLAAWKRDRPCCADLFRRSDGSNGPDCQAFDKAVSTMDRLS